MSRPVVLGYTGSMVAQDDLPPGGAAVYRPEIDGTHLNELRAIERQLGNNLVARLFTSLLRDTPRHLGALRAATAGRSAAELEVAAHTLKGLVGHLGMVRLQAICQELVDRARAGNLEGTDEMVEDLAAELERSTPWIEGQITGELG